MPKSTANVAATKATTQPARAASVPPSTESRPGPWVNAVFHVPHP